MSAQTALAPAETQPDLAFGKRAFASSVNGDHRPELAFDDKISTRWQAQSGQNQWLAVDLGAPQTIGRARLNWETANATKYRLEVSDDGEQWRPVYATDSSAGEIEDVAFAPTTARYVRVLGVEPGTQYGISLFDFEVRAPHEGKR